MKNFIVAMVCFSILISFSMIPAGLKAASGGPVTNGGSSGGNVKLINPLNGINNIEQLITAILKIVVQVGVVVCTFFIIYAGFLYVTAVGDEDKIKQAHSIFKYTVIGTMVLLGAQILSSLLGNTVTNIIK